MIFANHEAGTAVCIHPDAWILTCAHCIGESEEEWPKNSERWLLSHTGTAIQTECYAWGSLLDLALLNSIAVEGPGVAKDTPHTVPIITLANSDAGKDEPTLSTWPRYPRFQHLKKDKVESYRDL